MLGLETDMFHQFSLYFSVSSAIDGAIMYERLLTPANSKKKNKNQKNKKPQTIQKSLFPIRFLCLLYIDYILFTHKMGQQKIASVF